MKTILKSTLAGVCMALAAGPACAAPLDAASLKSMIQSMGYATSDLSGAGEPLKFEIEVKSGDFAVPIALEISGSGQYIWASAFLGTDEVDPDMALELLYTNTEIQPTSFWLADDDSLKIGIPIDNRDVTPSHLQFVIEKLARDVTNTADIWDW